MTRIQSMHYRVSTLALAVALAAGPSPVAAQSFQADGVFAHGSGSISTPDSVTTNITVDSSQAVIDWTPFEDGGTSGQQIVFQAGSTTATFSSATDFAVLNRIDVDDMTRIIRMDGTINSLVGESTGGSVYFYSPSGFVLGATSVINVGSLVLSARPITVDGNGNFINGGVVEFGAAADPFGNSVNPAAEIETHSLAQISALNEGSYVAMVAPRVEHHGTIEVNGAAALVGAEGATITFRPSGLFDVQVDVGTTDSQGVAVYGDITGPASSGSGDNHRIYLAAVPKNTALTMLISNGAELGFDVAQAADVVGNAVVLSAGHDVFFGSSEFDESPASGAAANANIFNSSFTSAFYGTASGNVDVTAAFAGVTGFASDANVRSSGGYVQVEALDTDSLLSVDGNLTVTTDRFGDSDGQSVTAGLAEIYAQDGGTLSVAGNVNVSANGYGGDSFTGGVDAGNGTGGDVRILARANSSLFVGGNIFVTADGYGGQPGAPGANAGDGTGGNVDIGTVGSSSTLGVAGTTYASASGFGGNGDGSSNECFGCDGLGGTGTGGDIDLDVSGDSNSTAFFGDTVDLYADGLGGRSAQPGSTSGDGTGGSVVVSANGDNPVEGYKLAFASDLNISVVGRGGQSQIAGITAGNGQGGFGQVSAFFGSSIGILGDLDMDAHGYGGYNDTGIDGGDGRGGTLYVLASGGDSGVVVAGTADLIADGEGSFVQGDCIGCGGVGGDGFGGAAHVVGGPGGDPNNAVSFGSTLRLSADGQGGIGVTGIAGNGEGGITTLQLSPDLSLTVAGTLTMTADGHGGASYDGNTGGDGIGGSSYIFGDGGNLDVTGAATVRASGIGGGTEAGIGGTGGDGVGGAAQVGGSGGSLDFLSNLFITAAGVGGDTDVGSGGNATGGITTLSSGGVTIHVFNNLFMDGSATGGDGATGGSATALISNVPDESDPIAVGIYAANDGTVTVDGTASLSGQATGGAGADGDGGNATAGEVDVVAFFGDISIGTLSVGVNAYGGNGGNGGSGGDALAGAVDVAFGLGAAAVGGTITLGSAFITADGFGGAGGAGEDANTGGDGGAGGNGTGGSIGFVGTAAGGMLITGAATLTARGEGGAGGDGGTGDTGAGGDGGDGGIGQGGFMQTGTVSANLSPTTGGGASYTSLSQDTSAFGGDGGDGGIGGGGTGLGGDGGAALGGRSTFLVRGVLVTADTVQLFSSATGGDGGAGSVEGNGGDATTGTIAVESKDRFEHPDQRGTLEAGTITGVATAIAGQGGIDGDSFALGGSYFRVLNGDADIDSVSITITGDTHVDASGPSIVSVRDGTATVDSLSFVTSGELALDASSGSMHSNTITLSAGTFVPDTFNADPPTTTGTYFADSFDITTGGDFITNANLVSASDLVIDAPGSITAADLTAVGTVDLTALGGAINVSDISAGGLVDLFADTDVMTGAIDAGDSITIVADTGAIGSGDLSAQTDISLTASLAVMAGNVSTPGNVTAIGDSVTLGDVGGSSIELTSDVGDVTAGDIVALTNLTIDTADDILFGSIVAPAVILDASGAISGGDIDSGSDIIATAGAEIDVGDLNAGGFNGEFVEPGDVLLTAAGYIATGMITAAGAVSATADGSVTTGSIDASTTVDLLSGSNIVAGNISAFDAVTADAAGSITSGDISASSIDLLAGADITTGDLSTQASQLFGGEVVALLFPGASVTLQAGGDISTGDISSIDGVYANAGGAISTGAIDAGDFVWLIAGSDILTGPISALGYIEMASGGGITTEELDSEEHIDLLAAGDIAITSAIAAQYFDVQSDGGGITTGDVTTGDAIEIAAYGGDVDAGNLSAGIVNPFPEGEYHIAVLAADGSATVDSATALDDVYMAASGNLTAGDIGTGGRFLGLAGGDMSFQAIATSTEGRIHLGDYSMLALGGDVGTEEFDVEAVFTADPIQTGGSMTFGGPVSTNLFLAAAGSLATISDSISAQFLGLVSDDIEIGSSGSIDAPSVSLISSNATQTIIGDGVTGQGYSLTNAEYGRISADALFIGVDAALGAAPSMLVGKLDGQGESEVAFATFDGDEESPVGSIRVLGEARFTGLSGTDEVSFITNRFELDAETGLLELTGTGGALAGTLELDANHIHVASGEILDLLADDLQYDGYQEDLNAPAEVQRPDGVIRAGVINIEIGNAGSEPLYTLYVQNMGTSETPAGFVATEQVLFGEDDEFLLPAGSLDVVINGQIVTPDGTLTGVAVRDALVAAQGDLTPFTENSTVNGCLLIGSCEVVPPEPPVPPDFQPAPGIQQEIVLAEDNVLPPPEFGNEGFIDDNDEETDDGETSPITPPDPLFDTSELGEEAEGAAPEVGTSMRSSPGITQAGDVDDPVSGSGNPALMETPAGPPSKEENQQ